MGLRLQWAVLRSSVPTHLRATLLVLALVAKEDGGGIWIRTAVLAKFLGLHRVTVSRFLNELEAEGLVSVIRRGGRWRTKGGKAVGRASERRINLEVLRTFGRSDAATKSEHQVPPQLLHPDDHVAASLREPPDLVAASLPIKPGSTENPDRTTKNPVGERPKLTSKVSSPS